MTNYHIHLVSDSTGETVNSVLRSVMAQFEDLDVNEHMWTLVRTKGHMERVIEGVEKNPGIVLYTIADKEMQLKLREACKDMKIQCVPVLSRVLKELSAFLGSEVSGAVGKQYDLDEEYFSRIEAINYTLAHDDGQITDDLDEADIVLVGVSRTSKTPTCVYLSYKGLKVANVPYVMGCPLPETLGALKKQGVLVLGLVISPERLIQIRKSRLVTLNENRDTNYVDMDYIKEEVLEARKYFNKNGWQVMDVTRKSIEESTAMIMQVYQKHIEGRE